MKPGFTFKDLLTLNKFITPTIMTVVYWVLMVVAIVVSLVMLFSGSVIQGIFSLILAPIYVRVLCEVMILLFKIHGVLCEIRDQRQAS